MSRNYNETYQCDNCGVKNHKLWRDYNTFLSHQKFLCAACAVDDQGKDYEIDDEGCHPDRFGGKSDQIGWLVPHVPSADGTEVWGYCAAPPDRVKWWKELPT